MTKWHINKHGSPAPCKAKDGNCPLGENAEHFNTKHEAQDHVNTVEQIKHGLLPEVNLKYKKASSKEDLEYVSKRKKELSKESKFTAYVDRCRSSIRIPNYKSIDKNTVHFQETRQERTAGLIEEFGEGTSIGVYEVDHLTGTRSNQYYRKQVIELIDNGRLIIYDKKTGRTVTTFMAHKSRIEAMMLLDNEIPDIEFLNEIQKNRLRAEQLGYN